MSIDFYFYGSFFVDVGRMKSRWGKHQDGIRGRQKGVAAAPPQRRGAGTERERQSHRMLFDSREKGGFPPPEAEGMLGGNPHVWICFNCISFEREIQGGKGSPVATATPPEPEEMLRGYPQG